MIFILKLKDFFLFFLLFVFSFSAFAQTPGLIFKPAGSVTGKAVLDPDNNGYSSATIAGFQGGIDYGAQSELKMVAIPPVTDEPVADLTSGATGGHTDIVGGQNSVYILNDGLNFIIRFRVGKNSTASKGYTVLIDTDELFGPADPSYTTANMGFEKEVTLETNFGVKVYDLVTPANNKSYSYEDYHQRSVAATNFNGDPDYFYDFYVPISDITATPATTKLRFAATSVTSAQNGTSGTISDINGIVDGNYGGNIYSALTAAITSFPATTINNMGSNSTFTPSLSFVPVITSSIATNSTTISGTSTEVNGAIIKLYRKVGAGAYTQVTNTPTVNNGAWSWTISGITLAAGDLFYATATASGKSESLASNVVEVTSAQQCYLPSPAITARSNSGNKKLTITWTWPTGVTPTDGVAQVRVYQQTTPTTFTEINGIAPTLQYMTASGSMQYELGGAGNITGVFYATITHNGCTSGYSSASLGNTNNTTTAPTILTDPIDAGTPSFAVSVKNNFSASATIILYVNGIERDRSTTTIAAGQNASFPYSNNAAYVAGDIVTARAIGTLNTNYLSDPSNSVTVIAAGAIASTAPVITGNYFTTSTTVSGTSIEQAGSTITLYKAGSTVLGTTTVNSFGNWTITGLTLALNDVLTAKVQALGKTQSAASNSKTVLAVATAPTAPIVNSPIQAGANSISGTGGLGAGFTLTVYIDGDQIGTISNAPASWTLSGLLTTDIFKGANITAKNTNTTSFLSSVVSNTVIATGIDHFQVEANGGGNIGTQTAGVAFPIQISARNIAPGNTLFNTYTGTNVVASGSAMIGGAGPTSAFTAGEFFSHNVTLTTAGTYTLTTLSTSDPTVIGTSNTFIINPGPANKLAINTQPSTAATNEIYFPQQPVIYIQDQYGNLRTSDNTTQVTVSIASGTGTLNGQLTLTAVNGVVNFSGLSITGTGAHTLLFVSTGLTGATSGTVTIAAGAPGAITALSYTTPHNYITNNSITPLTPTVTGTVTNYAVAPALPTGLSINSGTGIISGTPTVAKPLAVYTVTASNSGGSRTFDITITVSSTNATKLSITTQPSATAQSGVAFAQQPAIQLQDAGNTPIAQAGVNITVVIASGDGVLGGTLTAQTDAGGLATFSGLMITGAAGNRTLQFSSAGLNGVTSNSIAISLGPPALSVAVQSQTNVAIAGQSTGSIILTASGGTAPYTYSKDGTTFQSSATFGSLAAGTYTFTVKDTFGAISTVSATITQPTVLAVTVSSQTNPLINGQNTGSITLTGSGGTGPYTYSINGTTFQSSATFGSLGAGTYTFTVKDTFGAISTVSATITQPTVLAVTVSSQTNPLINGQNTGSVTLAGSGGTAPYTYSINGTTFQSSATFGSLGAGTYIFTVKDASGALSTVTAIITQPPVLAVTVSSQTNPLINGQNTGSVTLTGSGGAGPYTYSKNGTTFQSSSTFGSLAAGSYTFTVKDAFGAVSTVSIIITQPPVLAATVSSQTNPSINGQNTGSITLSGNGGTGPYYYSKDGNTFQSSATFGSLPVGSYTFFVKDASGAIYTINTTLVYVNSSPTDITLSSVSLYENRASGELAGRLSSSSAQPGTTYTYTLVSGSGDGDNSKFIIINDEIRTSQVLDYESRSSYSVRVKSTTQFGFTLEKVFTIDLIDVNETPTLNVIANQMLCYTSTGQVILLSGISAGPESGQSTTLTVSSDNPGLFQSLSVVGSEIRYTTALNQIGLATVTLRLQDNGGTANGGVDEISRTFTIRVNALPEVNISSSLGTSISKGATTLLTATGGSSYQWSNASGIISGQNGPVLTVRPFQGATYTVSVTNEAGCVTTQNITIQVVDDYTKLAPTNNFSPNGDGINDVWIVENLDAYPDHKLTIFDRGGRILYTVRNYDNTWDGRVNGALLDEGTYFYVFEFNKPGISRKKGFITIVH